VHKLRNVSNKPRRANRNACLKHAKRIYKARTRRHAVRRSKAWKVR